MIVLAADTSSPYNAVALCDFGGGSDASYTKILAEATVHVNRRHAEGLLHTTDNLMAQARISLSDVELLAVSNGPGSFTGLRVGVATWKGLALGLTLPLVGVPTMDALVHSAAADGTVCVLMDARMQEVFGAVYTFSNGRRKKTVADRVCPVEDIVRGLRPGTIFLGDGAILYRDRIRAALPGAVFAPDDTAVPRASAVADEGRTLFRRGETVDANAVVPVYLRLSQPEELRKRAREEARA